MTKRLLCAEEPPPPQAGFCDLTLDVMNEIVWHSCSSSSSSGGSSSSTAAERGTELRLWTRISFVSRYWRELFLAWTKDDKVLARLLKPFTLRNTLRQCFGYSSNMEINMPVMRLACLNDRYFKFFGLQNWREQLADAVYAPGVGAMKWHNNVQHIMLKHTHCLYHHGERRADPRAQFAALLTVFQMVRHSEAYPGGQVKNKTQTSQIGYLFTYAEPAKQTRDSRLIVYDRAMRNIYLEGLTSVNDSQRLAPTDTVYELAIEPRPSLHIAPDGVTRNQHLLRGGALVQQITNNLLALDALAQPLVEYEKGCHCEDTAPPPLPPPRDTVIK